MKPKHDFLAERALAQHCAELIPAALPDRDLLVDTAALARDLSSALCKTMLSVASGSTIRVICSEAARCKTSAFVKGLGTSKAHCRLEMEGGAAILLSVDHGAIHALTDRAYGGTGEVAEQSSSDPAPGLPLSADLTLQQLELTWRDALGRALPAARDLTISGRGSDLVRLDPFRGQGQCVNFEFSVEQEGHRPWSITFAACPRDLEQVLECHAQMGSESAALPVSADPMAEPFGDIVLPARAVLAETTVSLARASALAIGDVIPLAIAREVPLLIGRSVIMRGSIGAQNDCVALQFSSNSQAC